MSLPNWPGANNCYTRALRILESMARCGHVRPGRKVRARKGRPTPYTGTVSVEMRRLMDALNRGNEEEIKGLLLLSYYTDYERS